MVTCVLFLAISAFEVEVIRHVTEIYLAVPIMAFRLQEVLKVDFVVKVELRQTVEAIDFGPH